MVRAARRRLHAHRVVESKAHDISCVSWWSFAGLFLCRLDRESTDVIEKKSRPLSNQQFSQPIQYIRKGDGLVHGRYLLGVEGWSRPARHTCTFGLLLAEMKCGDFLAGDMIS